MIIERKRETSGRNFIFYYLVFFAFLIFINSLCYILSLAIMMWSLFFFRQLSVSRVFYLNTGDPLREGKN